MPPLPDARDEEIAVAVAAAGRSSTLLTGSRATHQPLIPAVKRVWSVTGVIEMAETTQRAIEQTVRTT